jgi:hypothetical protein
MKIVKMNCKCLETPNRCDLCGADFPKTGKHCFGCHMFFCDPCCVKNVGIRCQCFVWTIANVEDPVAEKHRKARLVDSGQSLSAKVIDLEKKGNTDASRGFKSQKMNR